MKIHAVCGFLFVFVLCGYSIVSDSSDLIFDNSKVYRYQLDFYVQDWSKALKTAFDSGKQYIPAKFTYGTIVFDSIGVRYKGNSSEKLSPPPRKPYKLKFDKYKNYSFFGLKKLSMSNCFKDPSFLRERICYSIMQRFMPASRTAYTNLYVGDSLIGFYVQVEDVDKDFLKRHYKKDGNNLYGVENNGATLEYLGDDKKLYDSILTLETNDSVGDWSALTAMLKALNNTPNETFEATMKNYLNLDACMRMFALDMVVSHFDSYTGSGRNFFLYDDSSSNCFQMIPWDFNEGFGSYTNGWNVVKQDVKIISNLAKRPLNRRIVEIKPLFQKYLRYIQAMINGPFAAESIAVMVDQIKPMIDPYVKADNNKPYSYQDFLDNSEKDVYIPSAGNIPGIKSFSRLRNDSLQKQLARYIEPISITNKNPGTKQMHHLHVLDNPHSGIVTISFTTTAGSVPTAVTLYSSKGAVLRQFFQTGQSSRTYHYIWDAATASAGYYYLEIRNAHSTLARKSFIVLR